MERDALDREAPADALEEGGALLFVSPGEFRNEWSRGGQGTETAAEVFADPDDLRRLGLGPEETDSRGVSNA
jgi:hypothetical protein